MRLAPTAQNKSPPNESAVSGEEGGVHAIAMFIGYPLCVNEMKLGKRAHHRHVVRDCSHGTFVNSSVRQAENDRIASGQCHCRR
jgi:hypothetical protein